MGRNLFHRCEQACAKFKNRSVWLIDNGNKHPHLLQRRGAVECFIAHVALVPFLTDPLLLGGGGTLLGSMDVRVGRERRRRWR